ncbi:MAG: hypothetical protein V7L26_19870 [Nostoc sp.]|uniref:hypothetical protein n=1 Tax=Nostoc sp. TaxID=1180 RepID=UPI002FFCE253
MGTRNGFNAPLPLTELVLPYANAPCQCPMPIPNPKITILQPDVLQICVAAN